MQSIALHEVWVEQSGRIGGEAEKRDTSVEMHLEHGAKYEGADQSG